MNRVIEYLTSAFDRVLYPDVATGASQTLMIVALCVSVAVLVFLLIMFSNVFANFWGKYHGGMRRLWMYNKQPYLKTAAIFGLVVLAFITAIVVLFAVGGVVWGVLWFVRLLLWVLVILGWVMAIGGGLMVWGSFSGGGCGALIGSLVVTVIGVTIIGARDGIRDAGERLVEWGFNFMNELSLFEWGFNVFGGYWDVLLLVLIVPVVIGVAIALVFVTLNMILRGVEYLVTSIYNISRPCPSCGSRDCVTLVDGEEPNVKIRPGLYGTFHMKFGRLRVPTMLLNGRWKLDRRCNQCERLIRAGLGYGTERHIGIVGAKSSGKSYLLYTGLDMQMTERKMSQTQATPETDIKVNKAKIESGQMPPTPKNMYTAVQLLFKKRRLRLVPYHLFFYDIAGEEFDGTHFDDGRIKFFRNVRTVVFVIDPLRVKYPAGGSNRKFVEMVNGEREKARLGDNSERYDLKEVVANFIAMLNRSGGIKPKNINVDIVCTKAEMYGPRGYFGDFGMDYRKASSNQIRAFVKDTMGLGSFVQLVENEFKVRGYWAVDVKSNDKTPVRGLFKGLLKQSGVLGNWWRSLLSIVALVALVALAGALGAGGYFGYKAIAEYMANRPAKERVVEEPTAPQPNYTVNARALNVRSAAGSNAAVVGTLSRGEAVLVHGIDLANGFAKITYNGQDAYVGAQYLTPITDPVSSSAKSGWSTFLLQGRVEQVQYGDGRYIHFNAEGNALKQNVRHTARGLEELEYVYSSPTRFVLKGNEDVPFKIVVEGDTRNEIWDNSEALGFYFTYDGDNRLVEVSQPEYGFGVSETYKYNGQDVNPSEMILEYYDETGRQTTTFTYSNYKLDRNGNWIRRSVRQQMEQDYESEETTEGETKTFTERRTITYY